MVEPRFKTCNKYTFTAQNINLCKLRYIISNTKYHSLAFRQIRELELGRERLGERCRIFPISFKLIMPSQMKGHIVFPSMISQHGISFCLCCGDCAWHKKLGTGSNWGWNPVLYSLFKLCAHWAVTSQRGHLLKSYTKVLVIQSRSHFLFP